MNIQSAVRQQHGFWHGALDGMLADCSNEVLNKNLPGATIGSIASVYAHIVFAEDVFVHARLQAKQPLYLSEGWDRKLGIAFAGDPPSQTIEWGLSVRMELPAFQEYAKGVREAVDTYLAGLSDDDLERKPDGSPFSVEWFVINIFGAHLSQHGGEIAALKGVQGLKGLPF